MNTAKNILNLLSVSSTEVAILKVDKNENSNCNYSLFLGTSYDNACLIFKNLPSGETNVLYGGKVIKQRIFPDDIKQWTSFVLNIHKVNINSDDYTKFIKLNYEDKIAKDLMNKMDNQ